jgi:hypothetical protein
VGHVNKQFVPISGLAAPPFTGPQKLKPNQSFQRLHCPAIDRSPSDRVRQENHSGFAE